MNAAEVVAALRVHYGDGFKLVEQVAEGTGYRATRWIDALAIGLWPSRGLELHAIEVKVSRGDVKRELAQPAKAEVIAEYCDKFWLATPAGLVDVAAIEAVVPNWGLLEVADERGRRVVKVRKPAVRVEARHPVDRSFMASILRRIPAPTDEMRAEVIEQVRSEERIRAEGDESYALQRTKAELERLQGVIRDFEGASGIRLGEGGFNSRWHGVSAKDIGEAVALLARQRSQQDWQSWLRNLTGTANTLDADARKLGETATDLRVVAALIKQVADP